jgi:hypothetical protein
MRSALACDLPPCREDWLNAGGERRNRLLAKRVCPSPSRHRALHETPGQFLLDLQQDHDGQDDQGSHERILRLAQRRPVAQWPARLEFLKVIRGRQALRLLEAGANCMPHRSQS